MKKLDSFSFKKYFRLKKVEITKRREKKIMYTLVCRERKKQFMKGIQQEKGLQGNTRNYRKKKL